MKTTALIAILIIYSVMAAGCKENSAAPGDNFSLKSVYGNDLYGTWVQTEYNEDHLVLHRAENLEDDKYGFIFLRGGKFVERKNSGWCGTPPIVYGNFEGTWVPETENVIDISVAYWGGTTDYRLEIVSLSGTELRVRYVYESQ